jgi:3-hydroxyisobutyrate dehydrogenase
MSPSPTVGVAGIGRMGLPIAHNLREAGFPLTVFNRTAERCEPLREAGAEVAASPAALAAASDVVVTMLADPAAARELIAAPGGLLDGARPGTILVEMSTIGPAVARELAELAAARGVAMLDAPVSGSVSVAEAGQLTAMVGGEREAFERALPVLEATTKARFHLGASGAGAAMKLALNLIIASTTQAVSEALVLAESAAIARAEAYEVIASSAVASPFVDYKRTAFLDPEGTPTAFALDLMRKDLALALELGEAARIPLLGAAASAASMTLAAGLRGGDRDLVEVAGALREVADDSNFPT